MLVVPRFANGRSRRNNNMSRLILMLAAAATAATATMSTAEARDGCGRGYYFNGRGCVPYGGGYGYRYGPGVYGGDVVRPTMGRNGSISCNNPNYTWQDSAC